MVVSGSSSLTAKHSRRSSKSVWMVKKCRSKRATALLKKFTSKVDGCAFVHFYLKVITSDVYYQRVIQNFTPEVITFR